MRHRKENRRKARLCTYVFVRERERDGERETERKRESYRMKERE